MFELRFPDGDYQISLYAAYSDIDRANAELIDRGLGQYTAWKVVFNVINYRYILKVNQAVLDLEPIDPEVMSRIKKGSNFWAVDIANHRPNCITS